jgi:hypothetical protein
VRMLGARAWVTGEGEVGELLERAGLRGEVVETEIFEDIPARTEVGRDCWREDEGGRIWELCVRGTGFEMLEGVIRERAKGRFEEEWRKLADEDGIVREEGRLWVGIGTKL